jgi:predicted secreted hydrolase
VQTYFGNDPAVRFTASPLFWSLGKQSIAGGTNVFPLHIHLEDPGDASQGRPPVVIDVDSAATNPLFLQGVNGFVGAPGTVGYNYYSWPQQLTTGTVTIGGTPYSVSNGLTWMDHQWGGGNPSTSGPATPWTGWSWFECQFQGNRSLTFSNTHGALPPSGIDTPAQGFGTYVDDSAVPVVSELFLSNLQIGSYATSAATGVVYPSAWTAQVIATTPVPISLQVSPVVNLKPQALWMGGMTEYAEAAGTVTAIGTIGGQPVSLTGVAYCESVGFEDPTAANARRISFLQS